MYEIKKNWYLPIILFSYIWGHFLRTFTLLLTMSRIPRQYGVKYYIVTLDNQSYEINHFVVLIYLGDNYANLKFISKYKIYLYI